MFIPFTEQEILADAVKRLSKVSLIQGIAIVVIAVLLGVSFYLSQQVTYFAVTNDGRLFKLQPLSQPVYHRSRVIAHGVQAISASFSLDFVNSKKTLTAARDYYTKDGFGSLMQALDKSGLLAKIEKEMLVASCIHTSTPVLSAEGVDVDGVYKWKIEFPIQFTLRASNKAINTPAIAILIIQRVPPEESLDGIGVASVNIKTT